MLTHNTLLAIMVLMSYNGVTFCIASLLAVNYYSRRISSITFLIYFFPFVGYVDISINSSGLGGIPLIKYMFVMVEACLSRQFKFNSRINDDLRRLYGRLDETQLALSVLRGPTLLDEA
jgi:hypothetical protein